MRISSFLHRVWQMTLSTLYPPKCYVCGRMLDSESQLCQHCRDSLPVTDGESRIQHGTQFSRCHSYCFYDEQFRRVFHRYKFEGHVHYGRLFGSWMAQMITQSGEESFDVLTWTPLHPLRKWKRGYDQAELLAREIGHRLSMDPVKTLRKVRSTAAQSKTASSEQRRKNVKDAYQALSRASLQGKRVLLVDDVITTGSTLENAASALRRAGAAEVVCVTLARSLRS